MPPIFNISYLYDSIIYITITLRNNMMYNTLIYIGNISRISHSIQCFAK